MQRGCTRACNHLGVQVELTDLDGPLLFVPQAHYDERGFFTRTFDSDIARSAGIDPNAFLQDSQSRSIGGVIRGLHGRAGLGEAKLVRCARGAVWDVVIDVRAGSATFGAYVSVVLDDVTFKHLYVPPGFLHGYQVLSDVADVCYRIDRTHEPAEDLAVHFADPDLSIPWPSSATMVSARDQQAGTWTALVSKLT